RGSPMKQLTGMDASFLYMETGAQFGHVSSVSIYHRPPGQPDYSPLEAWRTQLQNRLHLLEPLTRRLRMVPFGLDHPYWVDDPEFDLDFHVRQTAVAPPGTDQQLADVTARIVGRPLDRNRPLWESYVVEGLSDDRFAILTKVHHSTVDGASGAELLTMMLDTDPGGDPIEPGELVQGERLPTDMEMIGRAAANLARKPGRGLLLGIRTARDIGQATRNPVLVAAADQMRSGLRGPLGALLNRGRTREAAGEAVGARPSRAPKTPFNAVISPHRRLALRSLPLADVKELKNAMGATVNDVVMAMCAGGLRTWLEAHGGLPDEPLVAMVPVSVRTGDEVERWTNRVSAIFATIPTDESDPLVRLAKMHDAMVESKQMFDAIPADQLTEFAAFPPPAVFAQAMRTATRLSTRFGSPVNLVISNVPGPRETLYSAGAELQHYYPVSTITDGQGLNITVQSYRDTLDLGLVACRELVPDVWDLAQYMVDDLAAMSEAAGLKSRPVVKKAVPTRAAGEAAPRRTAAKKVTPKRAAARKAAPVRAAAKEAAPKKAAAKKAAAKKAAPRRSAAKKAAPKKAAPRRSAAKKAAPERAAAKKAAPRRSAAKKSAPKKSAPKKTAARKVAPRKSAARKAAAP
ncbi:MAG: WS/DGAT/MGAT family O-acyltransferase, partial [Acidimicrobiales bacterium]